MIPVFVCLAAFVVIFISAQVGMRAGALTALGAMLGAALGMFTGLRYWFIASRWISGKEGAWTPWHAIVIFWVIFTLVMFLFLKFRQEYTEIFESVFPSIVDRFLGALFGLGTGAIIATALLTTLTLLAPTIWPAYNPAQLPLPLDRYPLVAYQFIETHLAGIPPTAPSHTPLPNLSPKSSANPADFWQ